MEFVDVDVLAAQDAVDVVNADLDMGQPPFLDDLAGISRRFDLARFHAVPLFFPAGRLAAEVARKPERNIGQDGDHHGEADHDQQVGQRHPGDVA